MFKYILKRIILTIITITIAFTITFFILRMIDKTPEAILNKIQADAIVNKNASTAELTKSAEDYFDYHPDMNAFTAFGHYIKNIFHGDFGKYFDKPNQTIPEHFSSQVKWSFLVAGTGFALGSLIGLSFGIFAGYKRGKLPDIFVNALSILFVAIPSFVLAAILVLVANKTDWPTQFMNSFQAGGTWPMFKTLIIPISIVTVTSFASITYYIRNEVVEVLKSDYIATARSKGLSETQIFFKHVLRNIMIPAVTIILPRFVFIMLGSMIIEIFFGVPGSAKMLSLAITKTEINVILFSILFFTSLSLFVNIFVDILYTILDPRIKFAKKSEYSFTEKVKSLFKRKKALKVMQGGEHE